MFPLKIRKNTQTIISFISPENLIKTLFEQHCHVLEFNQIKYHTMTKKGSKIIESSKIEMLSWLIDWTISIGIWAFFMSMGSMAEPQLKQALGI